MSTDDVMVVIKNLLVMPFNGSNEVIIRPGSIILGLFKQVSTENIFIFFFFFFQVIFPIITKHKLEIGSNTSTKIWKRTHWSSKFPTHCNKGDI